MAYLLYSSVLTVLLLGCATWHVESVSSPIVIVPGILGNQIEGQLNKKTVPNFYCRKQSDWYVLWLSLEQLLPYEVYCLADNMKLKYDPTTGQYSNNDGVETRVPDFGGTSSIEYLDPSTKWFDTTNYFHAMVQHFVDKGYTRGKDIVGAPYDWRFSPNQLLKQGYYTQLKQLIETTYDNNNQQKVVLVAHSMGAINSLYFLTKMVDQHWKDMYLRTYITISGVWRGAAKSVKAFASGDNEGIILDRDIWGRSGQRTYPSTAWLLPFPSDTWPKDDIVVVTAKRSYSVWDYEDLFKDMNYSRGYEMFNEVKNLTGPLPAPNVTLYCLYGTTVDTPRQFHYGPGQFPDTDPVTVNGDGDGTVNINSLRSCERWKEEQDYDVISKGFPGVEHVHTIKNPDVIKMVDSIVYNTYGID